MVTEIRHRNWKMAKTTMHSPWWLTLLTAVWLLLPAACSSDSEPTPPETPEKQPTMLSIYVYAPDRPIMTRADIGQVAAETDRKESLITNLQIWVFTHDDGRFIGYLNPSTDKLNNDKQDTYMMKVDDAFAASRPDVDVYVLANVTDDNCGISFDSASEKSDFAGAIIDHASDHDFFGLTSLATAVPEDGLPMSGVLYKQQVTGENPVLHIGPDGQTATVKLTRIVSKLRFLFCQNAGSTEDVRINKITIGSDVMPKAEYLFLADNGDADEDDTPPSHVGTAYEEETILTTSIGDEGAFAKCEDPMVYLYKDGQEAQVYEDLLQAGLNKATPELTMSGPYYLRESDKKMSGTIHYTVDGQERTATFPIENDFKGNFQRNHTLVVYSYFSGGDRLEVISVFVKWNEWNRIQSVYNW